MLQLLILYKKYIYKIKHVYPSCKLTNINIFNYYISKQTTYGSLFIMRILTHFLISLVDETNCFLFDVFILDKLNDFSFCHRCKPVFGFIFKKCLR